MSVDQFCLKWNNFQTSIITAFESLQTTEDLADVTLTCEGMNIKAHKIILSACSPYFRTVFKENPCPHPIVILKDVLYMDLLAVLNFMYHGEVLIAKDQLTSFLQTAEILQVSGLIGSTDLALKSFSTSLKTLTKTNKVSRSAESTETIAKKPKISKVKTSKLPTQLNTNNDCVTVPNLFQKNIDTSGESIDTKHVEDIKIEVVDEECCSDFNENIENMKSTETSILETVLEMKEQPSILERSLTVAGKSPSTIPYPIEHVSVLHTPTEISKSLFVTKNSPDPTEKIILKPPEINQPPYDLTNDNSMPSIKIEEQSPKSVEICIDAVHNAQNEIIALPNVKTVPELQPHHSSQCGNCPHCGKVYSNQSALKYHVRLVHSDLTNMYCCHLCPESFDYREGYKKHMVEVHSIRN